MHQLPLLSKGRMNPTKFDIIVGDRKNLFEIGGKQELEN